jgi:hypothetical protein
MSRVLLPYKRGKLTPFVDVHLFYDMFLESQLVGKRILNCIITRRMDSTFTFLINTVLLLSLPYLRMTNYQLLFYVLSWKKISVIPWEETTSKQQTKE